MYVCISLTEVYSSGFSFRIKEGTGHTQSVNRLHGQPARNRKSCPGSTQYQYRVSVHSISTQYQYTVSVHSISTHISTQYQFTVSVHSISTQYQYTASVHSISTQYQYT